MQRTSCNAKNVSVGSCRCLRLFWAHQHEGSREPGRMAVQARGRGTVKQQLAKDPQLPLVSTEPSTALETGSSS